MLRPSRPEPRGVSRSSRHAGWDVVDAGGVGAEGGLQGGSRREQHPAHTTGAALRTAKSCGPGARSLAPSLAVMRRPDRARASAIGKATGAIVYRSPGRARHKPSTHCAGKAGCLASPVCRCAASWCATVAQWTAGASRHPAFPAPSALPGAVNAAKLGHDVPRGREFVPAVQQQFRAPGRSAARFQPNPAHLPSRTHRERNPRESCV